MISDDENKFRKLRCTWSSVSKSNLPGYYPKTPQNGQKTKRAKPGPSPPLSILEVAIADAIATFNNTGVSHLLRGNANNWSNFADATPELHDGSLRSARHSALRGVVTCYFDERLRRLGRCARPLRRTTLSLKSIRRVGCESSDFSNRETASTVA